MTNDEEDNAIEQDENENDEESEDQDMAENTPKEDPRIFRIKYPSNLSTICGPTTRRCKTFTKIFFCLITLSAI